jgi:hypothetical protein
MANALRQCSVRGSSPVEVEALMAELFADRLAQRQEMERAAAQNMRVTVSLRLVHDASSLGSSDDSSVTTPPVPGTRVVLAPSEDDEDGDEEESAAELYSRADVASVRGPSKTSPIKLISLCVIFVCSVVLGVILIRSVVPEDALSGQESPIVIQPLTSPPPPVDVIKAAQPEAPAVKPPETVAPPAPKPDTVTLLFDIDPPSASIQVDGENVESGSVVLPRSSDAHLLRLTAPGRQVKTMHIVADQSHVIHAQLDPMVTPHVHRKPVSGSKKSPPGRVLVGGSDL